MGTHCSWAQPETGKPLQALLSDVTISDGSDSRYTKTSDADVKKKDIKTIKSIVLIEYFGIRELFFALFPARVFR